MTGYIGMFDSNSEQGSNRSLIQFLRKSVINHITAMQHKIGTERIRTVRAFLRDLRIALRVADNGEGQARSGVIAV